MDYLCCETSHKMLQKYDIRKQKRKFFAMYFRMVRVYFRLSA
ncbi:hypothetical protein BN126_2742 [Cronobacter sakazakii 680]|nr:hypothetical protein BN126_2742 [Cronobacter sakazakii 680]